MYQEYLNKVLAGKTILHVQIVGTEGLIFTLSDSEGAVERYFLKATRGKTGLFDQAEIYTKVEYNAETDQYNYKQ